LEKVEPLFTGHSVQICFPSVAPEQLGILHLSQNSTDLALRSLLDGGGINLSRVD
jgi:hypothetical protein